MNALRTAVIHCESACQRAWLRLDQPRVLARCALLVPLAFGLLALLFGQDDNWDLHNYHRYNPYALLNGKIGFDLAPAQWQSYFNPALDLLYYGLTSALPAPLAGFIMGLLHGLNFVLVLGIARALLQAGAAPRWRLPLLLALAGCLAPGFLSELGNSMGDNLTALCVLGALLLVLARWQRPALLAAGLLMGVGVGFKLTNATYALALCLALLSLAGPLWTRVWGAFKFGVGVLAGIGASAGFWYWKMWQVFGNPLFPQFNDRFHAPLAAPIGIGDTGWLPKGLAEKLLWPFIFTLHPQRVIEVALHQVLWPILYVAFCALALRKLRAAILGADTVAPLAPPARAFLIFFALSYLIWLNLFGIYRYLVPIELLAPLALWLVAHALMPAPFARGAAGYAIALATLAIFPIGGWGHAAWSARAFTAQVPVIAQPAQSMVFTVHGDPPMGWLVPFFPAQLAFVALGSGFPESDAFGARVAAMIAARSGPLYVMLQAPQDGAANQLALDKAAEILARYGLRRDAAACVPFQAFIGKSGSSIQLCTVQRPAPG
ncbi:MAG: glycosyltransferase 87 family protein [Pseudomonadota bacterium]|nr:glycosyltransferase 87 family protein [Pseudomonadota bacterium]